MYLSRLILNPRSRDARRDLADCQEMHRTLMGAFDDLEPSASGARERIGLLYRVETDARRGTVAVLAQSRAAPKWEALPDGWLVEGFDPNPAVKPVAETYGAIRDGMVLVFRLRANPTRRVGKGGSADCPDLKGKRVGIRGEDALGEWLARKGTKSGFALCLARTDPPVADVRVIPEPQVRGSKLSSEGKRRPLRLDSVRFDGRLRVTDAARFAPALASGIGTAKAYGFGLLSIAPSRG